MGPVATPAVVAEAEEWARTLAVVAMVEQVAVVRSGSILGDLSYPLEHES